MMEPVSYLGQTLTRWRVGSSNFLAAPEKGARLMSWSVTLGDGTVRDVLFWPEAAPGDEFHKIRGGNPILFPFNGRCFDHGDIFFWRSPDGVRRAIPMHGLARQGTFKVAHADDRSFAAVFQPGADARAAYPFDYEFTVIYRFAPLGLSCEFVLANHDTQPIPWSAGHHFYFTLPWTEGHGRKDYAIRLPASKALRQTPTGTLVPGKKFAQVERLDNPDLIDSLHTGLKGNEVVFGPANAPGEVRVRLGIDKVPAADSTFVTWTMDDQAPYYCVEPWMGPPNAPENKLGLHWVAPGQRQSFFVEVDVK